MSQVLEMEAEARHPLIIKGERDKKAWAKRIMYRADRGDSDLKKAQIAFAKAALETKDEEK
jgi:hypothetical protein